MHGELVADDHRQQARPARPRGIAWCGAGGCVMASQARQLNFSRRLHHLPLPHHLQRLRDVFPQLDQIRATTAGAGLGRGQHDPLARQIGRQRRPLGLAAGEGAHRGITSASPWLAFSPAAVSAPPAAVPADPAVAAPFRGLAVGALDATSRSAASDARSRLPRVRAARSSASARSSANAARNGHLNGGVGGGGHHGRE